MAEDMSFAESQKKIVSPLGEREKVSQQKFRKIFERAPIGIATVGSDFRFREFNSAFLKIVGYSYSELIGKSFLEITHSEDRAIDKELGSKLFSGQLPDYQIEKRYICKNGKPIWIRLTATVFNDEIGGELVGVAMIENIDERRKAEESLKTSEERFKRTFVDAPIGICMFDTQGALIFVNKVAAYLLGYEPEELAYKKIDDITFVDDRQMDAESRARLTTREIDHYRLEKRFVKKDGSLVWTEVHATNVLAPNGNVLNGIKLLKDITDRKYLQQVLENTEVNLNTVVSTMPVVLFSLDASGTFILCEGNGLSRSGVNVEQILGRSVYELYKDSPDILEGLKRALAGESVTTKLERNGLVWETCYYPIFDKEGRFVRTIGLSLDITERELTSRVVAEHQKMLIRSSKLTALGQMASGISHEINNPLTVVYGNACQLRRMLNRDKLDLKRFGMAVEEIIETSKRIEKIIDGLRAFSRESDQDPLESEKVIKIVEDTLRFCEMRIRTHGIDLIVEMSNPELEINCRAVQISEILLNLLNNSHDAVNGTARPWIKVKVNNDSENVYFTVSDSGAGICKEIQEKMFQPFFTTKSVGEGTGLGLSISKGLAEANGGSLQYDSKNYNTSFTLSVPKLSKQSATLT